MHLCEGTCENGILIVDNEYFVLLRLKLKSVSKFSNFLKFLKSLFLACFRSVLYHL